MSLFAGDLIIHAENPKNWPKIVWSQYAIIASLQDTKLIYRNQFLFYIPSNEQVKFESKNKPLYWNLSEYLSINLTKYVQ